MISLRYLSVAVLAAVATACGPKPADVASCPPGERYIVRSDVSATAREAPVVVDLPEIGYRAVCLSRLAVLDVESEGGEPGRDPVLQIPNAEILVPAGGSTDTSGASIQSEPLEPQLWGMAKIRARDALGLSEGRNATIVIIDTGVDCEHPDLPKCSLLKDYVPEDPQRHWHGTHVAGSAAAAVNGLGVLGVAPSANIVDARVLDRTGAGYTSVIARAILDASKPGWVLNLSLGGEQLDSALSDAVAYAISRGAVVVAAAGNYGSDRPSYPACIGGVIGVGATDKSDKAADFSNWGQCVDIGAPGVDILSTAPGAAWALASGTSMSSPHVAGAAASLVAFGVAPREVLARLKAGADPGPAKLGGSRLNVHSALLRSGDPLPATAVPGPTSTRPDPYPGRTSTPTPTRPIIPSATRPAATARPSATPVKQCSSVGLCEYRSGGRRLCGPCGQ